MSEEYQFHNKICKKKLLPEQPFRLDTAGTHYESLITHNLIDILISINNNLTKYHDDNDWCILSLLGSKPKCTFDDTDETCECDKCIHRWMNLTEER